MFANSSYNLPNTTNPRLAGGMTWTGRDYAGFLRSVYSRNLLSSTLQSAMYSDQVGAIPVEYSPAFAGLGQQWHYGYGVWLQCASSTFNCSTIEYYSSPGAYGAYPFLSWEHGYFGILARQGDLGTYVNGFNTFEVVKSTAEQWAQCENP